MTSNERIVPCEACGSEGRILTANGNDPDPLSLESLIAWLEKQPSNKVYCYMDRGHCLAAQYNASIGRKYDGHALTHMVELDTTFDDKLERIAIREPRTFGAALKRARALSRTPIPRPEQATPTFHSGTKAPSSSAIGSSDQAGQPKQ